MRRFLLGLVFGGALLSAVTIACGSSEGELVPAPNASGSDAGPTGQSEASTFVDASLESDASSGADADASLPLGEPLVVEPADFEKWVWIPIPSMHCADGSPAGVAANFTNKSR